MRVHGAHHSDRVPRRRGDIAFNDAEVAHQRDGRAAQVVEAYVLARLCLAVVDTRALQRRIPTALQNVRVRLRLPPRSSGRWDLSVASIGSHRPASTI